MCTILYDPYDVTFRGTRWWVSDWERVTYDRCYASTNPVLPIGMVNRDPVGVDNLGVDDHLPLGAVHESALEPRQG